MFFLVSPRKVVSLPKDFSNMLCNVKLVIHTFFWSCMWGILRNTDAKISKLGETPGPGRPRNVPGCVPRWRLGVSGTPKMMMGTVIEENFSSFYVTDVYTQSHRGISSMNYCIKYVDACIYRCIYIYIYIRMRIFYQLLTRQVVFLHLKSTSPLRIDPLPEARSGLRCFRCFLHRRQCQCKDLK